jgi:hypothetical protein
MLTAFGRLALAAREAGEDAGLQPR